MANLITLEDYKTSEKIESTKDDTRLNSFDYPIESYVTVPRTLIWPTPWLKGSDFHLFFY